MLNKKQGGLFILIFIIIFTVLTITMVQAGFWDMITGRAPTQQSVVTVFVGNTAPVIQNITNYTDWTDVDITEDSTTAVTFRFLAVDVDGAGDIDNSTAKANFTLTGTEYRENTTCAAETYNGTATLFACIIDFWYWDKPGTWNVIPYIADDGGSGADGSGLSKSIILGSTVAITISPTNMTFPSAGVGATDTLSNNDPITINNTANYNVTMDNVQVNARDLIGADDTFFGASNFSVNIADACNSGYNMINGTAVNATGSLIVPGNRSAGASFSNETLYFCMELVPVGLSQQAYTAQADHRWTIEVT